jgi:hypothetical protein
MSGCAAATITCLAAVGGQINADPHGELTLSLGGPRARLGWYTDTLLARAEAERPQGRGWAELGGQFAGAGLLAWPWRDGAPAPEAALFASTLGGEVGAQRYLPAGLYLGGTLSLRRWRFSAVEGSTAAPPEPRNIAQAELIGGLYRSEAVHLWGRAGLSQEGPQSAPHLVGEARYQPIDRRIGPHLRLSAGLAEGQTDRTTTRLGGLNPHVVPLAGAGWGEWWVEDYAALRVGASVGRPQAEDWGLRVAPIVDLAAFDGQRAYGLGALVRAHRGRGALVLDLGHAPAIVRQPGIGRSSLYLSLSVQG